MRDHAGISCILPGECLKRYHWKGGSICSYLVGMFWWNKVYSYIKMKYPVGELPGISRGV